MNNFFQEVKRVLLDSGFSIKENAIVEFTKEVNKSQQIPVMVNGQYCQMNQESNYKVIIRALGEGECDGQSFDVMEITILQNENPIDEICESFYHNDITYFKQILKKII